MQIQNTQQIELGLVPSAIVIEASKTIASRLFIGHQNSPDLNPVGLMMTADQEASLLAMLQARQEARDNQEHCICSGTFPNKCCHCVNTTVILRDIANK